MSYNLLSLEDSSVGLEDTVGRELFMLHILELHGVVETKLNEIFQMNSQLLTVSSCLQENSQQLSMFNSVVWLTTKTLNFINLWYTCTCTLALTRNRLLMCIYVHAVILNVVGFGVCCVQVLGPRLILLCVELTGWWGRSLEPWERFPTSTQSWRSATSFSDAYLE